MGISQKESWKQVCDETQSRYVDGGILKSARVEMDFQNWVIVLDTYTVMVNNVAVTYTRMRALFSNKSDLKLRIYRKGLFSGVAKLFGLQDIQIGSPSFDEAFVIKGNDEANITRLLDNRKIRELINSQKAIDFRIKEFRKLRDLGVSEMNFQVGGVIKDVERLKELFSLFCEMLTTLSEMNIAGADRINAVLK